MNSTRTPGKKSTPHLDPTDPPRRRANKRKGHGTYANDRPPIISVISRETGEQRFWVCDHADTRTCQTLIAENVAAGSTWLYTDEWQSYRGSHRCHATVRHGVHEWARYEAMVNAKRVTPHLIRRMCVVDLSVHTGYT